MYKWTRWKKILFCIIFILVALRIAYIGFAHQVDKKYSWSSATDLSAAREIPCDDLSLTFTSNSNRLNSVELLFNNIGEDKNGSITFSLSNGDTLLYQTNLSLKNINNNEWKRVYINAEIEQGSDYRIFLNANEDCTQIPTVFVVQNASTEIRNSFSGKDQKLIEGNIAVSFGYLVEPTIFDCLIMILLNLLLLAIAFMFLQNFEKVSGFIKEIYINIMGGGISPSVLTSILEMFGCAVLLNCSGIEFQPQTKIILYAISLLSAIAYDEKIKFVSSLANSPPKKAFLVFLYLYAAFALVGQRIMTYPLRVKITIAGLFVFFVTCLWFVPVMNSVLYGLDVLQKYGFGLQRMKTISFIILCCIILIIPALLNLYANNPGISTPDTVGTMTDLAKHLHGMYDWHPAFYCMVLRLIQAFSDTTYAVIAVQYFFWTYVMLELLLFLRKRGMNDSILIAVTVFLGLSASNVIHVNTIWKDIPYAYSLLWSVIVLAKMTFERNDGKNRWYIYLEFVIAMVGVCLYRKNGVVPFLLILLAAAIVLRKNVMIRVSCIAALALVMFIKGPVYQYFDVVNSGTHGLYIGLGNDILGVYYAGGEVSNKTLAMITEMTSKNNDEYAYNPTYSKAAYDISVTPVEFVVNYIDTFLKNPVMMIRALIDRQDALWDIYAGQDTILGCVNDTRAMDDNADWRSFYPARRYVAIYPVMSAATAYTASSQWICAIEWRSGLFTLLGLAAFVLVFLQGGKKRLLIFVPILGQILSLVLSTGWADFRYYWPLNLMNLAVILILVTVRKRTVNKGNLVSQAALSDTQNPF